MDPFQLIVQIFDGTHRRDPKQRQLAHHSQAFLILNLSMQESDLHPESNLPFSVIALVKLSLLRKLLEAKVQTDKKNL